MLRTRVEALGKERGLTLAAIERLSGIGEGQIKKWDDLQYAPRADKVLAVAKVLETTVEKLMEPED